MKPFPPHAVQVTYKSPLGRIHLLASENALLGLWFDRQDYFPALKAFAKATSHPVLDPALMQLEAYFLGRRKQFSLPLDLSFGTPFQQSVWRALQTIAPGKTSSYGAIASAIGRPAAVRAVGGAIGRNPISIVVPCHRIIGNDGRLTGYAGGLPRKIALLQLESTF